MAKISPGDLARYPASLRAAALALYADPSPRAAAPIPSTSTRRDAAKEAA